MNSNFTGNKKITNLLLQRGATANVPDQKGRTPLILAADSGIFDENFKSE